MAVISKRKQEIYEAAVRLFRTRGFAATSMRDLAREVDLTASSLYNHISSKEEILREICFSTAARFAEGMMEVEQASLSCRDKVRMLLRQHIHIATSDRTSITSFNDEWRHLGEPFLTEFKAMRRDYEDRFRSILEEGIERGEFQPVRPNIMLYTLLSAIRWVYDWYEPGHDLGPEDLEEEMIALLLEGVER